jgi:uncharacterized protein (DUF983 family)
MYVPIPRQSCPYCGSDRRSAQLSNTCPDCGREIRLGQKTISPAVVAVVILAVVLGIASAAWFFS